MATIGKIKSGWFGIDASGFNNLWSRLDNTQKQISGAVYYALGRAADQIRDTARSAVTDTPYKLSHETWIIRSRISQKLALTSEVGFFGGFEKDSHWHIKLYDKGATRANRGYIIGQHFLSSQKETAEKIGQDQIEQSLAYILQKNGLS